jgi:hypothetical protein
MGDKLVMRRASNVGGLFRSFYDAWGPAKMKESYNWDGPPKEARFCEMVYMFTLEHAHEKEYIGYGSLTQDTLALKEYRLSLGIFPLHSGRGYRKQIVYALAEEAFTNLGATDIQRYITGNDPIRMAMMLRAIVDSPWRYSGQIWYPNPVAVFAVNLEDWNNFYGIGKLYEY